MELPGRIFGGYASWGAKRIGALRMLILRKFWACESGATAVEYGLIVTIFTALILGGYSAFSDALSNQFSSLANGVFK